MAGRKESADKQVDPRNIVRPKTSVWDKPIAVSPRWDRICIALCSGLLLWWFGTEAADLVDNPWLSYAGLAAGAVFGTVMWFVMKPEPGSQAKAPGGSGKKQ